MFGTLKPARVAFDCRTRHEWQQFYCGTCQGLGDQFGLGYRGLLSHDAVFLGLLVDALQVEAASPDRTRCPMLPIVHRPTVSPSSVAMRYAAAVQLLLADQWLADRAIDGRSFARIGRPLLQRPAERARATLAELGSDLAELIGIEDRQASAEIRGATDPEQAAEPTAAALELVFERIAGLPGMLAELPESMPTLARLGRALGTVIYLVDALEDLDADRRAGDFNPCLVHDYRGRPTISASRVRQASALLERARADIRDALASLPLRRHAKVLENILLVALGGRVELALVGARRLLAEADQRRRLLAELFARSGLSWFHARGAGLLRFSQALLALGVMLVTGLFSRISKATSEGGTETETGGETGGDTVGETGDAATRLDLPPDPETVSPEALGGGGCPCFSWVGELIQGCCGGLSDACSDLCGAANACGSCMSGCGDTCGDCGQNCGEGCSGCGNACSGCGECGNVCSGCGECGNVCSGCGDCGNACSGCGDCGNCGNCGGGGGGCNC